MIVDKIRRRQMYCLHAVIRGITEYFGAIKSTTICFFKQSDFYYTIKLTKHTYNVVHLK